MAGYDEESQECELYTLDYLASMVKANFAAHGYGGFFTTAIMDRDYRKGKMLFARALACQGLALTCLSHFTLGVGNSRSLGLGCSSAEFL